MKGRWLVLIGLIVLLAIIGGLLGTVLYAPEPSGAGAPVSLPDLLHGWRGWAVLGVIAVAVLLKLAGMVVGVTRRIGKRKP